MSATSGFPRVLATSVLSEHPSPSVSSRLGLVLRRYSSAFTRPSLSGSSSASAINGSVPFFASQASGMPSESVSGRCGLEPAANSPRLSNPSLSGSSVASTGERKSNPYFSSHQSGRPSESESMLATCLQRLWGCTGTNAPPVGAQLSSRPA